MPDIDRGSTAKQRPLIAVCIGDPAGVGPEIAVKALQTREAQASGDVLLIGNRDVVEASAMTAGSDLRFLQVPTPQAARGAAPDVIPIYDDGQITMRDFTIGQPSAAAGRAMLRWIRLAVEWAETKQIEGFIIAPVDDTSFRLAGIAPPLPEMHPPNSFLLRAAGSIRMVPIGEHVMMRDVPGMVTRENVLNLIVLIGEQLRRWGFADPKIAVAGLNPHAAGVEDREEIAPAVQEARQRGFNATGPLSPDAVFRQAGQKEFDVVVAMYHDQGQIAIKTSALDEACSIFVGLPYVRVGVPHGSAMEIAGKNKARFGTMLTSLRTAVSLASGNGL